MSAGSSPWSGTVAAISVVAAVVGLVVVLSLIVQDRGREAIGPGLSTAALLMLGTSVLLRRAKSRRQPP